jgi:hypothetical protein
MDINENWKIESDELNITLYHRNTGNKSWRAIAYFSNPQDALDSLVHREIMGDGMKDIKTVVEKINDLEKLIRTIKGLPDLLESAPRITKQKSRGIIQGAGAEALAGS